MADAIRSLGLAVCLGCTINVPPRDFGSAEAASETSEVSSTGRTMLTTSISGTLDPSGSFHSSGLQDGSSDGDPPYSCGDGVVDGDEDCDGEDFDGEDCASFGWDGGELSCSGTCTVSTEGCVGCGNGKVDPGEACDGDDLGGASCESEGQSPGALGCNDNCTALDVAGCGAPPECGDETVNGEEECDGADLGGETCASLGLGDGDLECSAGCAHDTSGCAEIACVPEGEPCFGPDDCCNTGCGAGGSNCQVNGEAVCCS